MDIFFYITTKATIKAKLNPSIGIAGGGIAKIVPAIPKLSANRYYRSGCQLHTFKNRLKFVDQNTHNSMKIAHTKS